MGTAFSFWRPFAAACLARLRWTFCAASTVCSDVQRSLPFPSGGTHAVYQAQDNYRRCSALLLDSAAHKHCIANQVKESNLLLQPGLLLAGPGRLAPGPDAAPPLARFLGPSSFLLLLAARPLRADR